MNTHPFPELIDHNYMSLKTFRKSGEGVATPVWFAEKDGTIYVVTSGKSGKAKRIRNNGAVEIAPCDVRGGLLGEYALAEARILGPQSDVGADVLNRKYGWQLKGFMVLARIRRVYKDYIYMAITPRHET